jgi:hypothetical protein
VWQKVDGSVIADTEVLWVHYDDYHNCEEAPKRTPLPDGRLVQVRRGAIEVRTNPKSQDQEYKLKYVKRMHPV